MNRLKNTREAAGLTQSELAEKSGVTLRMIRAYEQNTKDINKAQVATVIQLAEALGCDIKAIINDKKAGDFLPLFLMGVHLGVHFIG